MAVTRLLTADELAALPDDGYRYDLVRGELRRVAPAGFTHGKIASEIGTRLHQHVREHRLGVVLAAETGFLLERDPDTVLAPDAAFVRADRVPPEAEQRGFASLAPDLVVEVVSPSDRASEVHEKALLYLDTGVQLVWLIYPQQRTVAVYQADRTARLLKEQDELGGGAVLPDFRVRVAELFQ